MKNVFCFLRFSYLKNITQHSQCSRKEVDFCWHRNLLWMTVVKLTKKSAAKSGMLAITERLRAIVNLMKYFLQRLHGSDLKYKGTCYS